MRNAILSLVAMAFVVAGCHSSEKEVCKFIEARAEKEDVDFDWDKCMKRMKKRDGNVACIGQCYDLGNKYIDDWSQAKSCSEDCR
jgi:hypothetical protein